MPVDLVHSAFRAAKAVLEQTFEEITEEDWVRYEAIVEVSITCQDHWSTCGVHLYLHRTDDIDAIWLSETAQTLRCQGLPECPNVRARHNLC